jgi:hypothetical protein
LQKNTKGGEKMKRTLNIAKDNLKQSNVKAVINACRRIEHTMNAFSKSLSHEQVLSILTKVGEAESIINE